LVAGLGVPVSLSLSYLVFAPRGEVVVAFAGVLLQWFGLAFVAWGILGRRKDFGRLWFRRLVGAWKPRNITLNAGPGVITLSGSAIGMGVAVGPNPTIEEQLHVLNVRIDVLQREVKANAAAAAQADEEVRQHVARESKERAAAINDVRVRFEKFAVKDIHLEGIGLFWLFVGVLLTSVPGEVAKWVF
jgi:hypothetical protein